MVLEASLLSDAESVAAALLLLIEALLDPMNEAGFGFLRWLAPRLGRTALA